MGWKRRPLNVITHTVKYRLLCQACGVRFSRQKTFQATAAEGQPRSEVREALVAQGRDWVPPALCGTCADGVDSAA